MPKRKLHFLTTISLDDQIKVLEEEIDWCKASFGASGKGKKFEKGFIAGLHQAIYLLKEMAKVDHA